MISAKMAVAIWCANVALKLMDSVMNAKKKKKDYLISKPWICRTYLICLKILCPVCCNIVEIILGKLIIQIEILLIVPDPACTLEYYLYIIKPSSTI